MKEFIFYIRNDADAKASLTPEQHLEFIKSCESYINKLQSKSKLIAAQPLIREGVIISKKNTGWNIVPIQNKEVQVGYYHIVAADLEEAIEIAKDNPEFEYVPSAKIEVRPIKMKEEETKFVYPK